MGKNFYSVVLLSLLFPCMLAARNINVHYFTNDILQDSVPSSPTNAAVAKDQLLIVGDIYISGNKKTKNYIIERELPFKKGDTLSIHDLTQQFITGHQQLINTQLFHDATIYLKQFRGLVTDIQIDVRERWYIIPLPYVKPVDRNLSAWADKGYKLNRLNYGLKFFYDNFTGRNDKLKLYFITGYTHQYQASYDLPYAFHSVKNGFGGSISYAAVKELNVNTIDNQQFFLNVDSISKAHNKYINELFNFTLSYYFRPAMYSRHIFRLGYTVNKVDSSVLVANPNYFKNNQARIAYPEFTYSWRYQDIDYIAYPRLGKMLDLSFNKKGISEDMNLWQFSAKYIQAWPLGWKLFYVTQSNNTIKLPFDQPFVNQRLFGYGDFYLRGLEKYVVDGVAGVSSFNTLKREIVNTQLRTLSLIAKNRIPLQVFVKAYSDFGYSYMKGHSANSLQNQFLYTYGAGVDVVTSYDLVFRFEYSCNQLGEKGFFFHLRNDF